MVIGIVSDDSWFRVVNISAVSCTSPIQIRGLQPLTAWLLEAPVFCLIILLIRLDRPVMNPLQSLFLASREKSGNIKNLRVTTWSMKPSSKLAMVPFWTRPVYHGRSLAASCTTWLSPWQSIAGLWTKATLVPTWTTVSNSGGRTPRIWWDCMREGGWWNMEALLWNWRHMHAIARAAFWASF